MKNFYSFENLLDLIISYNGNVPKKILRLYNKQIKKDMKKFHER